MRKKDKLPRGIMTIPLPVPAIIADGIDDQEFRAYVTLFAIWYRSRTAFIEDLTATELGRFLGVHKSVAGAIVNRMHKKGLIVLDRIKDDRNKVKMRVSVNIPEVTY